MAKARPSLGFLAGGGEMGALMRAHDWTCSPLGPPQDWPDALKMAVSICLNSRFPMVLWWGADFAMLYNDAWRPVLGVSKHPSGLGRPGIESWPEIWDIIGPQLEGVLERGEASWSEDLLLVLDRHGYREEAYFTYSYSPIKHADGRIGGVFSAVSETTGRVLGERRLRTLRELAERTADAKGVTEACEAFADTLGPTNPDLPFALLYLVEDGDPTARLICAAGIGRDDPRLPGAVPLDDGDDHWGVARAVVGGSCVDLGDLARRLPDLPGGAWEEPTRSAVALPLAKAGQRADTAGVLVAGISPRRALDAEYRGFLGLVAGHLGTAIANARAYEEQRESEANLRLALAAGRLGSWTLDLASGELTASAGCKANFGRRPDEPFGYEELSASIHPEDRERQARVVGEAIAGRAGFDIQYRCITPAGEIRWVDVRGRFDGAGRPRLIGVSQDITEPRRAEEALRKRTTELETVLDTVPTAVWFTHYGDASRAIGNRQAASLLRLDEHANPSLSAPTEERPTHFRVLRNGGAVPVEALPLQRAARGEEVRDDEIEIRFDDGAVAVVLCNATPIRDASGALAGAIAAGIDITARKRADAALREAEASAAVAIDAAGMGRWEYRPTSGEMVWDARCKAMFGLPADGPVTLAVRRNGIHREDRERLQQAVEAAFDPAGTGDIAEEVRTLGIADGVERWVALTGRAFFDDGRSRRLIGVARDVTARKQAEERLRESEARFRAMADSAPAPVWVTSAQGGVEFVNRAFEEIAGLTRERLLGDAWTSLIHPDDLPAVKIKRAQAWTDGHVPYSLEARFRRADGEWRWMQINSSPRRDGAGAFQGYVGMAVDVTETRRTEVALRSSNERLSALVAQAAAGLAETDLDGRFVTVNERFCATVGRSREDLLRLRMYDITHPDDLARNVPLFQRCAATGEPFDIEKRYLRPDGSSVWVSNSVGAIKDAAGRTGSVFVVSIDIGTRKAAQEALVEARRRAEALAAERSAVLGQLAEGVIVADREGRIVFVNEAAAVIHGVAELDVSQEDYSATYRLFTQDGRPYPSAELPLARAVSKGETVFDERWRIRRTDGTEVLAIGGARPVRGPDGAQIGAVLTLRDDTAREAAERRLAESEENFRTLADNMSQFAWMADAKGWIYWYNRRWYEYTGTSAQEMEGWGWRAVHHPDHVERVVTCIQHAWDTGEDWEDIFPLRGKEGAYRWFLSRARPIRDAEGRILRWFGTNTDITEQRDLEGRLRQREAELKRVQVIGAVGALDVRIGNGFHNERSPEYLRLHGLPPEAVNERHEDWVRRLHPDDRERAEGHFLDTLAHGERDYTSEYRIVRPDNGEVRWIAARGEIQRDAQGRATRLLGVHIDVTELKGAQEALRKSRKALKRLNETLEARVAEQARERKRIFDLSRDLFAVAGFDGYLRSVNPAWTPLLGYDEATLLSKPFAEIIHPDDRAAAALAVDGMRRGEVLLRFEDRLLTANGGFRWVSWSAVPEGNLFYAVGRDVTEEKTAADALAAAHRALLAHIEERETMEATLRQMQRLEAVGQLTSGVAHDFNNLLTVILGNISFLERAAAAEPGAARRLANIRMAAERGAGLTGQLLAFSRRQRLEPKVLDLNEIVRGMLDLLRGSMGGSVLIETVLSPSLSPAFVDPTQIELVILNLAINARDAMAAGGALTIETGNVTLGNEPARPEEPGPGDYVMIAVGDTGSGMSEEVRARVFEPFFTTKDVGKGSGLGLAQVYGFAKQSGGGVRIDTAPGAGTAVRVYLPRASRIDTSRLPNPTAVAAAVAAADQDTLILIVDDDAAVREVTAMTLQTFGYRVIEAGDGAGALDALDREPDVALLLLDFAMPGMNGAEVAARAWARRPGLPILFVTGYADRAVLPDAGEACVVQKPFRDADLAAKVAVCLRRSRPRGVTAATGAA